MKESQSAILFAKRIQNLFNNIAKSITSSLETKQIEKAVMAQIELFFQPKNWSLLRLDPVSKKLYFVIAKGMDPEVAKNIRLHLGEGVAGEVAKTGKSMLIKKAQEEKKFTKKVDNLSGFKTESIIAVPIIFQKNILGVIELINVLDNSSFTKNDLLILETIGHLTGIALTNAMAYERISWIAIHDPLTDLYNRMQLANVIEISKTNLLKKDLANNNLLNAIVVWIDIDNFKDVNDIYTHIIGDQILVKVGKKLLSLCNEDTYAFRIGGDEFLLISLNVEETALLAKIKYFEEQLNEESRFIMPATGFSFGIASGKMKDLEQLIKEADHKMYASKKRNKEVIHT